MGPRIGFSLIRFRPDMGKGRYRFMEWHQVEHGIGVKQGIGLDHGIGSKPGIGVADGIRAGYRIGQHQIKVGKPGSVRNQVGQGHWFKSDGLAVQDQFSAEMLQTC